MRITVHGLLGRSLAASLLVLPLAACATPDRTDRDEASLLAEPLGAQSVSELIIRESQGDGCLVAGNAGRNRSGGLPGFDNPCRELRDVIAPPQLPDGVQIITPPPLPEQPESR
ncbi:hypothetical protein [Aurantiacibacter marinus]|uniref:Lipoprotein n=1 Tax=Aurantiacibacter marinus TaxID=874156 RepID=A0A0H0XPQ6_9SPHN|nr:hypothetical protein [Aurantiacibacter marinus]KLI64289.1 hypothetical protein AAV99_01200 [Aurantiacibacter marinus]